MITVKSFTFGDYYNTGTITVEYHGQEYTLARLTNKEISREDQRYNEYLHAATFFLEDDCTGYSEKTGQYFMFYDGDYDSDGEPTDEVCWLSYSEYVAACQAVVQECIDNNMDVFEDRIKKIITDKERVIIEPVVPEPVVEPGIMQRLKNYAPDYSYEDLLEERLGEEVGHMVYAAGAYAITKDDTKYGTRFRVYYVTGDNAELDTVCKLYEEALDYANSVI